MSWLCIILLHRPKCAWHGKLLEQKWDQNVKKQSHRSCLDLSHHFETHCTTCSFATRPCCVPNDMYPVKAGPPAGGDGPRAGCNPGADENVGAWRAAGEGRRKFGLHFFGHRYFDRRILTSKVIWPPVVRPQRKLDLRYLDLRGNLTSSIKTYVEI